MLEQVVMNLAINARDAMPKGGELVIETENVMISESDALTHPDFPLGRYVLLSVTDTGVGMDKEVKERLFEPFFTTKEPGQGTGLGLSTVYGIVKQHQGQIHFESEQGKGSTFKVYLPIVERSAADVGTKIERPVKGGTETILIAEDESDLRRLVKRFLERAGYSVLEASDGREAIDLFRKESSRIDLLLLDVVMPETGGHEVFEEARRINPKIRTLFTSGYSEDGIHTDFVLQEHCRLLQKPYEIKDLLRQVREVLDLKDS
jgi:CheY-like chemotaxis protein